MSRVIAADLSARSSLKKSEAVAAIKARASLIADFKNGEYKLYTPETGLARTDFASMFNFTRATVATVDTYAGVADIASGQPRFSAGKGLRIEESRENLLSYSEDFDAAGWTASQSAVTVDATQSPDGTLTADSVSLNNESGGVYRSVPCSENTPYTGSVYVKDDVAYSRGALLAFYDTTNSVFIESDIIPSMEAVGNGWYRLHATVTTPAGCTDLRFYPVRGGLPAGESIFIWGAQLEEGSFPTTYIPTTVSSVVRNTEVTTHTYNGELNPEASTIYLEADLSALEENKFIFDMSPGVTGLGIRMQANGTVSLFVYRRGESLATEVNVGTLNTEGNSKVAASYRAGKISLSVNGSIVESDNFTNFKVDDVSSFELNGAVDAGGGNASYIVYSELLIIPEALTADELKTLTEID